MAESEDELKGLLMKVKEGVKKTGLNSTFRKLRSWHGPITSWQIDGETMETVRDITLGAPKSLHTVTIVMKLKDACSLEGKL